MLNLTYNFKLIPNKKQVNKIEGILTVCKSVWNYNLAERKDWVKSRKCRINSCSINSEYIISADVNFPNYYEQANRLTKDRKNNPYLKSVNAQVLQQVIRSLDKAWNDMFKRNFGFPRFKNIKRIKSFVFPQFKTNPITDNTIKLPSLGVVKFRQSREIPEGFKVKQVQIVRKASGYYMNVMIALDIDIVKPIPHGHAVGIDAGISSMLSTSDGLKIQRPEFISKAQRKIKLLQRRLKKKQTGSSNWNKLSKRIALLHEGIANRRKEDHFQLAHKLCETANTIFVEDINLTSWSKGIFAKQSRDMALGQFLVILEYVCTKTDTYFAKVNKDYTSQICPECNTHTGKKSLDVRIHFCSNCGYTTDRDIAAAQVIRNRGLEAVGMPV